MNKSLIFTSLIMTVSLLMACHNSPLKAARPEKQIALLLNASRGAEKTMNLYSPPGGGYYLNCMNGNEADIDCQQFFKQMLLVVHQDPDFKKLTIAELTDQALFATIAEDYHYRFFNSIEG
jgi:hypothetical protein